MEKQLENYRHRLLPLLKKRWHNPAIQAPTTHKGPWAAPVLITGSCVMTSKPWGLPSSKRQLWGWKRQEVQDRCNEHRSWPPSLPSPTALWKYIITEEILAAGNPAPGGLVVMTFLLQHMRWLLSPHLILPWLLLVDTKDPRDACVNTLTEPPSAARCLRPVSSYHPTASWQVKHSGFSF